MALYKPTNTVLDYDRKIILRLVRGLGITQILATLLYNKGIKDVDDARLYLYPDIQDLRDPFDLADMGKAVKRIKQAIENCEHITIYGDYDVDGITASSILYLYLRKLDAHVDVYIPHRYTEGYGLNTDAIEKIANEDTKLLITVDCGISSFAEIEYARELNIDTIVTDHHNIEGDIPKAFAVVNPMRSDNSYYEELAGVGVASKIIHAMGGIDALQEYLDLIAIGTIADIVPLSGDNRILAALGLKQIKRKPRLGI
ncbi:MAG: single-stranded-DNA-specific exonuclease RecJ, partial [Clostridiales bacterium]|nr:single-stranded-DNA-specific exonuclease RecJ [Clostridiales bacterium]